MHKISYLSCVLLLWTLAGPVHALDVNISPDIEYVETADEGKVVRIQRIQDQNNVLTGGFSKTSRKCPPFCIQPMQVAPGVKTVGELELLDFIKNTLNTGSGLLIDARTPSWHLKGTIPGSINVPFTTFSDETDPLVLGAALRRFGVVKKAPNDLVNTVVNNVRALFGQGPKSKVWDFDEAKVLLLWCNGMWCGQSPRAIKGLLKLGYPAEKILYYRGGMQSWQMLGLTVVIPQE